MERTQYEIAIAVADLDCEATGDFRRVNDNNEPKFCILGGLYATINPDWAVEGDDTNTLILESVRAAYGLDFPELRGLARINDNAPDVETRRARIKIALGRRFRKYEPGADLTPGIKML